MWPAWDEPHSRGVSTARNTAYTTHCVFQCATALDNQSIHAQTIIPFVFQEHTSIHAQTIIPFVFQEHTLTRASMPKPYFRSCSKSIRSPEHPCPNHNSVRVPRAYAHQSIHAQTVFPFVFQEHTLTRASMPKPQFRSCSKSIRSPEHPCPNRISVRAPRAYAHQSIHAQTIIPFVFQEHTLTRASMPKPQFRSCSKSIRSPEHPCPNHNSVRVPRAYAHQGIHAQTTIPFVLQEHTLTRASMPKPQFRSCSKSIRSPEHPCPKHNNVRARLAMTYSQTFPTCEFMLVWRLSSAVVAFHGFPDMQVTNMRPHTSALPPQHRCLPSIHLRCYPLRPLSPSTLLQHTAPAGNS